MPEELKGIELLIERDKSIVRSSRSDRHKEERELLHANMVEFLLMSRENLDIWLDRPKN